VASNDACPFLNGLESGYVMISDPLRLWNSSGHSESLSFRERFMLET
jgi:hypothetical protein